MTTLMRHVGIWFALARTSFIAELEYRANIIGKMLADVVWYFAQLSLYEVLFSHTSLVADWTLPQMRVFMSFLFLIDCWYMVLFHDNLDTFSEKVSKGELDLLFAKPINAQFLLSFHRISTPYFVNMAVIFAYMTYAIGKLEEPMAWYQLVAGLVAGVCGVIVMYGVRFTFSSLSMIITRADSILQLWYQLYRLATRPDTLFPSPARIILHTVLPMAFIVSVPARIALGKAGMLHLVAGIALSVATIFWTKFWWGYCVRRYSSASS